MNRLPRWVLLAGLLSASAMIQAAEKLFLSGAELTNADSAYYYIGTALPLPGSNLAGGYVLHLWADYQTYTYPAGAIDIDARIDALSAAIGYHDSGDNYWWNGRLGVVQADTRLSPHDPANESAGIRTNLKLQLEGERRGASNFKINGNLEYIPGRNAHWARVRFLRRNESSSYHGPELIHQGDRSYSAFQLGWAFTEMALSRRWRLGIKGGLRFDENTTSQYLGVELSSPY